MSPRSARQRVLACCFLGLLLAGCATRPPTLDQPAGTAVPAVESPEAFAAQSAREAMLAEPGSWRLRGRVAFAAAGDGATVLVDWTQRGEAFDVRLSAPITGRQWRLSGRPGEAALAGFDDGPRLGSDAEALLFDATGWRLPVRLFPYWARGARGPGAAAGLAVAADGRPLGWRQAGWQLHFRDWWPGEPALPRRVFADAEGASVRLVVAEWSALPE